jgi:hypothetical protein
VPQHDFPAASVIAQQYSTAILIALAIPHAKYTLIF